jgi:biotin transport system permease protein
VSVGVYVHQQSPLHALTPGVKLLVLAAISTALVLTPNIWLQLAALILALVLFRVAKLNLNLAWQQIRPVLPIIFILLAVQWFTVDPVSALSIALRLSALVLLAALVSITTKVSAMIEAISWAVRPLAYLGISPTKIGLTISLALRFIPLIAEQLDEVREAQRARGLERNVLALVVPLLVRTLKMATEIGDAIEARSFDPDDAKSPKALLSRLRFPPKQ